MVGNGTAQAMTTNSTATQSYLGRLYVLQRAGPALHRRLLSHHGRDHRRGAGHRHRAGGADRHHRRHAFRSRKISWTSSGNGDTGAEPFPAGTFVNGGVQNVGSMASNTWNESCWTFSYLNNTVPAAGTYHRRRALHDECAMIAPPHGRCRLFFWRWHSAIIWAPRGAGENRSPSMIRARRRSNRR